MKGDKAVETFNKVSNCFLFIDIRVWNVNRFHPIYINTAAISNTIYMGFKILVYKLV